jgi:cytochrome c-type biogenesis protein CcmF
MFWLGHAGLVMLTVGAAGAAIVPSGGRGRARFDRLLSMAAAAGGLIAVAVLARAFLANDWRLAYTVGHARPEITWPFRLAGVWAGPEGSLLLWTAMLAAATAACSRLAASASSTRLPAALTAAYGAILLTVAQPFERLVSPPGRGNGLQPVLEHPAMVWHPPILYLGLIALLVPSALILGSGAGAPANTATPPTESDDTPAVATTTIERTVVLGLAALTAGLATGSNWAYVELGWGGYWAWDPIENAGLVAWLAAGALLHRLSRGGRGDGHKPDVTTSILAALVAAAVVWATTITRTGVLNSVHSFADRPALRAALLAVAISFTAAVSAAAVAHRSGSRPGSRPGSRSVAAVAFLLAAAVVVAFGTYEPAIEALVGATPFTVSGRFYTVLLWPLAVGAAAGRGWSTVAGASRATTAALSGMAAAAILAMVIVGPAVGPFGLGLAAAGGVIAGGAVIDPVLGSRPGWLTHLGLGVLLIGVAGTTASSSVTVVALLDQPAETTVGTVLHRGVELEDRPGTAEAVATVEIVDPASGERRRFAPRLVTYVRTGGSSAETATDRGWLTDTQVVLLDGDARSATYRINRQQRISLVWLGSAITVIGLVGRVRSIGRGLPAPPSEPLPSTSLRPDRHGTTRQRELTRRVRTPDQRST